MPKNPNIKKVLVIGSGPIVIGQAAEFDYAGTQACRSLKEEGMEVVLLNSNPATIMTDKDIADRVYIRNTKHLLTRLCIGFLPRKSMKGDTRKTIRIQLFFQSLQFPSPRNRLLMVIP